MPLDVPGQLTQLILEEKAVLTSGSSFWYTTAGRSASKNRGLLNTVPRQKWGYTGVVVFDWGAVYHRVRALVAGTELEMPSPSVHSLGQERP